jgi:hypothetical protein
LLVDTNTNPYADGDGYLFTGYAVTYTCATYADAIADGEADGYAIVWCRAI